MEAPQKNMEAPQKNMEAPQKILEALHRFRAVPKSTVAIRDTLIQGTASKRSRQKGYKVTGYDKASNNYLSSLTLSICWLILVLNSNGCLM